MGKGTLRSENMSPGAWPSSLGGRDPTWKPGFGPRLLVHWTSHGHPATLSPAFLCEGSLGCFYCLHHNRQQRFLFTTGCAAGTWGVNLENWGDCGGLGAVRMEGATPFLLELVL